MINTVKAHITIRNIILYHIGKNILFKHFKNITNKKALKSCFFARRSGGLEITENTKCSAFSFKCHLQILYSVISDKISNYIYLK